MTASRRRGRRRAGVSGLLCLLCSPLMAQAEDYEVRGIDNRDYEFMFFEPAFLRIEPGDSVTFVVSDVDHLPRSVLVPPGAGHWEAEPGKSITVTFRQEGVYVFDCAYHAVMGMAGILLVGSPLNLDDAKAFIQEYSRKTFAMNPHRLDIIWERELGRPDNEPDPAETTVRDAPP